MPVFSQYSASCNLSNLVIALVSFLSLYPSFDQNLPLRPPLFHLAKGTYPPRLSYKYILLSQYFQNHFSLSIFSMCSNQSLALHPSGAVQYLTK